MSVLGIHHLARDLEHTDGVLEAYRADRAAVIARYPLQADEIAAVTSGDADWLLRRGINPIVIRNLFVIQGVAHRDLYRQTPDQHEGAGT